MVLDLHTQPLANSYHKPEEELKEYPLQLNLCTVCWHTQLSVVVDPDEMFKHYLYVSGTTETLRQYFKDFYEYVNMTGGSVLDIACNDGSQLEVFRDNGWQTYGIDPAENLYELSSQKGFDKIICDYFNKDSATKLDKKMDVIIAQNVFAHTDDIHDFLRVCKSISHDETRLFIQTSQANMFENGEFDTIYHEHLSFFNVNSMMVCAEQEDWFLKDVIKTDIHGTSYVFELTLKEDDYDNDLLTQEWRMGKTNIEFYEAFARKAKRVVVTLKERIENQSGLVIGYGAAAKANTLLNFGQIKLDFIVDDNPMKHGLLTPGMNIPIKSPDCLKDIDEPITVVPLAWNFSKEIKQRVAGLREDKETNYIEVFG
jgi:hypothetical protein